MESSKELVLQNTLKKIEEIYSQANVLYDNKEYELAFRMISSSSSLLGILKAISQFYFIHWKVKILGIQYSICINQNKPDYNNYLFYFTSSICYEILRQLAQFPTNQNFFRWREQFNSNSSEFFLFKNNSEFDIALTELDLFKHKYLILERIYKFCFEELPLIYGIKSEYLYSEELKKYFKEKSSELVKLIKEFESISSKEISFVTIKIGNSVREIYKIAD